MQCQYSCEATLLCGNAQMLVRSWQEEAIRYVPKTSQEVRVKIWSFVEEIEERNSLSGKFRRARMVPRLENCLEDQPGENTVGVKMPSTCS